MNKVIVVGASSFTGRHFCKCARREGAEVIEANLRYMPWFPQAKDNYVVNFAAVNMVAPSWQVPGHYMNINVNRITEMADGLIKYMPKKYVHVSTPEVYGSTGGGVVTEDNRFNPSTPYAVSRAAAEMMLQCYHRQYGLPVVFTRGANVYGPGQQLYRLIPKMIACIKKGIKFPLEGNGASERSFVHVEDVVDAIWKVMLGGTIGEAYHISRDEQYAILGVVQTICHAMGKSPYSDCYEVVPERPGKDASYQLSSAKIRRELGWEPVIDFVRGLDSVIDWMNANWATLQHQPMEFRL